MERYRKKESGKRKSAERCQLRACEQKFRQAPARKLLVRERGGGGSFFLPGMWQERERERKMSGFYNIVFNSAKPNHNLGKQKSSSSYRSTPGGQKNCIRERRVKETAQESWEFLGGILPYIIGNAPRNPNF
jgi:hypothetical protein